jgi:hypothetical protein
MKQCLPAVLALVFIAAQALPAWSQTETMASPGTAVALLSLTFGGDFWSRSRLTGNWGGVRDLLTAQGLSPGASSPFSLNASSWG